MSKKKEESRELPFLIARKVGAGMETTLQFGACHQEICLELGSRMCKLRGCLLSYVEMLGLPETQEQAFKATVKAATSEAWTSLERLVGEKLERLGNSKKIQTL